MSDEQVKRMANDAELKDMLKFVSDAELLVSEITGGFSLGEILQAIKVADDVPDVIKDASVAWPEFKALDDDARADLIAYAQANCKFPANLTIEQGVEKALEGIIMLSKLV